LRELDQNEAARVLEDAVQEAVVAGETTPDLGGLLSTQQVAERVKTRCESR
jgi:isocitrate/isopropylmalate dehydrogenase